MDEGSLALAYGVTIIGMLLVLTGLVWLVVVAFKTGETVWGIVLLASLTFPFLIWILSPLFCLVTRKGWTQLIMMIAGFSMMILAVVAIISANTGRV